MFNIGELIKIGLRLMNIVYHSKTKWKSRHPLNLNLNFHPRKSAFVILIMTNSSFLSLARLFSAASSDSIRFHSNLLSHDNDLRVSIDNTCTDSLVTALDDEALLINDYMNDMSRSKVRMNLPVLPFISTSRDARQQKINLFSSMFYS